MTKWNSKFPTEAQEQTNLIEILTRSSLRIPELQNLFSIPNERLSLSSVKNKGGKYGVLRKLKGLGMKSGVPDLFLAVPMGSKHGLFIEMKRVEGCRSSKLRESQIEWANKLRGQNYEWVEARGCDDAIEAIEKYLDVEIPHY